MSELFEKLFYLPPPFNMVVLIVSLFAISSLLSSVVKSGLRFADRRATERFKLELVQSGISVEEAQKWVDLKVKEPIKKSSEFEMPS